MQQQLSHLKRGLIDIGKIMSTSTIDARFNRPQFNGICPLADNQPTDGLKSIIVKESLVGGKRVGRSP